MITVPDAIHLPAACTRISYLNPLLAANYSPIIVPWCGNIKFNQRIKWPYIKIRFICDVPSSAFFLQQVDPSLAECPSPRCAVVQFGFVFILFWNPASSWTQRRFPPPILQKPQSFSSLKIVVVEPKPVVPQLDRDDLRGRFGLAF